MAYLKMGPKSRFLASKSEFYHTTPSLANGLFVALGETGSFPYFLIENTLVKSMKLVEGVRFVISISDLTVPVIMVRMLL